MGIDILDISMRLEKRFEIKIQGDERFVAFSDTAGTLTDFVWQKLNGVEPAIPDLIGLNDLICQVLQMAPSGRWRMLGSEFERRLASGDLATNWNWFEQALGHPLPKLERNPSNNRAELPRQCRTPFRLAVWIWKNHPDRMNYLHLAGTMKRPPGANGHTYESCWCGVTEVLVETLGVKPDDVKPDSHLIEDLGME